MAKSKTEGTIKKADGEAKARRAPARRRTATKAAPAETARVAMNSANGRGPTHEEIARVAYEIYLERGAKDGSHLEDWQEAERRLRNGR
jgi:hypothetical protein